MTNTAYFVPAADLLPYWPHDLLAPTDVPIIGPLSQRVGVTAFDVDDWDGFLTVTGTLAVWEELELKLPLVDGLSLVLGRTGGGLTQVPFELRLGQKVEASEAESLLEGALTVSLKGYLPPYELVLPELDVKLRVARRYLKPMVPNVAGDPLSGFHEAPADVFTEFVVRGAVAVSTETGVRVDGFDRVDLDYAQIGSTGVVIRAEDVGLRLSDAQPPVDVDPESADLPEDFKGVFFRELSVYNLKAVWDELPASMELTNWSFGAGGVTGKAAAVFELAPDMAGRTFALRTVQLVLEQNVLVQALVQGAVRLEFWDDRVLWLDLGITNDPDLEFPASLGIMGAISAEQPPGTPPAEPGELLGLGLKPGSTELVHLGVSKLTVRSAPDQARAADQGEEPDTRFFDILIDGRFQIMPASGVSATALGAEVRELGLQVAPTFSLLLPGGLWIDVSEELLTKLAALPVRISRVGLGQEGDETWVGLDARVALAGGAVGASVKGLRLYFGGAAGVHLEFTGIELKIVREPSFSLYGFLTMTSAGDPNGLADPGDRTFQGGVALFIGGSVAITVDGSVLFGTKSGTKFWYVALDAGFGAGIPLGSTGVSLFGAALMLGNNVAPNKQLTGDHGDAFNWYRDWYRPDPGAYSVINSAKWRPEVDHWAVGAGASIGSSDGKAWSMKAFFALLMPGPVIIIEGRLKLFSTREPHTGPPTSDLIRGLVVLDFDEDEFLLALEVDHKIPASGLLVDVHAEGEIFYRHARPRQWHVAVGWYEPISRRVRATALKLFNWDFYLIATGSDLELAERTFPGIAFAVGYRTGFDKRWKFGPVRVVAAAWFSADVAMSFKPVHVLGQVGMHGELAVKAFGFGFELGLDARLALEAPAGEHDLYFAGVVEVHIGLPWPVPDIDVDIPLSWGDTSLLPPPVDPLVAAASVTPGYGVSSAALYNREQPVTGPAPLPMDGRLVIDFYRPMQSAWAPAPTPDGLARPDQVGEVWYRYVLGDVRVRVTPAGGGPAHDATEDLFGQWALAAGDDDGPQATSLILWGLSPYPAAGALTWPGRIVRRTWEEIFFSEHDNYPCGDEPERRRCVVFDPYELGPYDPELRHQPDPARPAVVFRALPRDLDPLRAKYGEVVQVPVEVVAHAGQDRRERCLRFARTIALGKGDKDGVAARPVLVIWGIEVELPASRLASGLVDFPADHYDLRVRARLGATVVAEQVTNEASFKVEVDAGGAFDHLDLLLEPRVPPRRLDLKRAPCLVQLCWTSLGMLDQLEETEATHAAWGVVLESITEAGTGDPSFGAHLVHEPGANYRVELDIRAEQADSVDGPWTEVSSTTEVLTVRADGAPAELAPYLERLVPGDGDRPVYADYDLRVTYNRQYVEAMYAVAGDPLRAELADGMGRLLEPVAEPGRTAEPVLPVDVAIFVDRLLDSGCVSLDPTTIAGNDETVYRTRLATRTAYEVRLRGGGHAQPLHRWAFTTSRWRTFAEHVADLRPAPWEVALPAAADLATVTALLAASGNRDAEDDALRQAMEQHLGQRLGTLPDRSDVTLLWASPSTLPAVRALVVASPEPLFTGRMVVRLLDPDGAEAPLGWLRARDGTRALAVPLAGGAPVPLPAGDWRLEFRYRLAGVAGLPDLTRQGSAADEVASWAFTVGDAPVVLVDPEA